MCLLLCVFVCVHEFLFREYGHDKFNKWVFFSVTGSPLMLREGSSNQGEPSCKKCVAASQFLSC